ncbi:phosphatase PAP2 family protein [Streptomyces violaceoruber]|uniref:Integral membrane protein n=4 Tax=Streptomyces TaxID=1883 RepID=A0A7U9E483_STRLI|nr:MULTISPECIES: phosphatase PAP2 family protein [Streptomyces]QSJ06807.1 integral membrane protein [Streptomyces lividans]BDD76974.1 inositol phosphorylceramide synthase [Streptomyces coelicolor]AIJ11304.1 integral membrane protein [Streptomyces lividans TK24]EFD64620.1 integral membrane protein [Streptomyces lividans TK24]EOY52508.1 integral membrane protein [Streptomyces lividans 1326]
MKTTPTRILSRRDLGTLFAAWRRPRAVLWTAAGVVTLGFLIALEIVARHYGVRGPITNQAREVVFSPRSGPLLYAGLALTMVVLTWRQRLVAAGAAIGIDVVFLLMRWAVGADPNFGNGALWVVLGCAVVAVTRRTGSERALLLKGAGLGLLLVAGHKTGDTWLLITSETRKAVLDPYVATADQALGNPSWLVGRFVDATGPVGGHVLHLVYGQLPLAAALVGLYQLRHVAVERRFPSHHLVRTFLVIGLLGPAVYMVFPVVGPVFAYGADGGQWAVANLWPHTLPPAGAPHAIPFDDITPRNCMPSLHTAWATTLFIHSRKGSRGMRFAGTFWLVATLTATLGFGYHYGADLVAGVVFALTVEAAMRASARGWDGAAVRLVAYGTTVFAVLLVAYRHLPVEMARYPWAAGPLLLLAAASVVLGYLRTTRRWEAKTLPARQPEPPRPAEPQPELV